MRASTQHSTESRAVPVTSNKERKGGEMRLYRFLFLVLLLSFSLALFLAAAPAGTRPDAAQNIWVGKWLGPSRTVRNLDNKELPFEMKLIAGNQAELRFVGASGGDDEEALRIKLTREK